MTTLQLLVDGTWGDGTGARVHRRQPDPHVPFGGAESSGYGPKEQGRASREFFTHTTTVYPRGG